MKLDTALADPERIRFHWQKYRNIILYS